MKHFFFTICLTGLLIGCMMQTSCSNDDDYRAELPAFSDVKLRTLAGNSTILPNDSVEATLHTSKSGRWIRTISYSWDIDGLVISSPSDAPVPSIRFKAPAFRGTYVLKITVRYAIDAGMPSPNLYSYSDGTLGFSVRYSASQVSGEAKIEKKFTVQ